jgi:hypothetical protein
MSPGAALGDCKDHLDTVRLDIDWNLLGTVPDMSGC